MRVSRRLFPLAVVTLLPLMLWAGPAPSRMAGEESPSTRLHAAPGDARTHDDAALAIWTGPVVVGGEFQVNTWTTAGQNDPDVAQMPDGGFVVVWTSIGQDGDGWGIRARRFGSSGAPLDAQDFQVNTWTTADQNQPAVAADGMGGFMVVWTSNHQDGSSRGIFGQRFDEQGQKIGGELQINTFTTDWQMVPQIAMNGAGEFVVAWESWGGDGFAYGVSARRFDAPEWVEPIPLGPEFVVNTYTPSHQRWPAVSVNAGGEFVVTWVSMYQGSYEIFGQAFDSDGLGRGLELQVNGFWSGAQINTAVAMADDGGFIVVWESSGQDLSGQSVNVRYVRADGQMSIEGFLHQWQTGDQRRPDIASDGSGNFMMTWDSWAQDGDGIGVFAQDWQPPSGPEWQVNSYTTDFQDEPAVSMNRHGDMTIVWQSFKQDGSDWGIFAQRYRCRDVDSDGLCNYYDIMMEEPLNGSAVSCSDPAAWQPTIEWEPGNYDRFKVYMGYSPGFEKGTRVTSGKRWMQGDQWTPSRKKWKKACKKAVMGNPFNPGLYIMVMGKDRDMPKRHQHRMTESNKIQVQTIQ